MDEGESESDEEDNFNSNFVIEEEAFIKDEIDEHEFEDCLDDSSSKYKIYCNGKYGLKLQSDPSN